MKRTEIRKGETYAVMTPSQKVSTWRGGARFVTITDAEGFYAAPDGYHSRSREYPEVAVEFEGQPVVAADYSHRIEEPKPSARTGEVEPYARERYNKAKGFVQVVEEQRWGGKVGYKLTSVQLSHIRMTKAEYERQADALKREQERMYKARAKAEQERTERQARTSRERDRLNKMLVGSPYTVKVVDGQIVLTGDLTAIRELVEDIEHDNA